MIETCEHHISTFARNYDPTRTTGLRNAFVRELNRRFAEIKKIIRKAIIDEDVFGLKPSTYQLTTPGDKRYAFGRSSDKVKGFMQWLNTQVDKGLLDVAEFEQVGRSVESAWTNKYVRDSYKRGVIRARYELDKAGFDVPSIDATGGIEISMATPFHLDRLGLLYTRTFEDMRGLTEQMKTQVSRTLTQGIADGDNPRLLAKKLVSTIDGTKMGELGLTDTLGRFIPAQRRAEMIARTEIIRAHHAATIQEYRNWAVEGVVVQAEWQTAGDDRVCQRCKDKSQTVNGDYIEYTLDEIQNMIPLHPMCRCVALPKLKDGTTQQQSRRVNRNIKGEAIDSVDELYDNVKGELEKRYDVMIGGNSFTEFGHSRYLYVNRKKNPLDLNLGNGVKVRVSDHNITSTQRIMNEILFNVKKDNIQSLKEIDYILDSNLFEKKTKTVLSKNKFEIRKTDLLRGDKILSERVTKKGNEMVMIERTYKNIGYDIIDKRDGYVLYKNMIE